MKRIEFLAPVAAMRGNLGETQRDIVYPTHDNSAYDGPEGERNTARNYQPIIVGAKRANGRSYFCVKTKTTNHLTPKAKKSMATMGAMCAVYSAMKKEPTIAAKMDEVFAVVAPFLPQGATMKSYFMERIATALRNKDAVINLSANSIILTVNNPFVLGGDGSYDVTIRSSILVKFWMELAVNPIIFTVELLSGSILNGIANIGMTFEQLIANDNINILGIESSGSYEVVLNGKVVALADGHLIDVYNEINSLDHAFMQLDQEPE